MTNIKNQMYEGAPWCLGRVESFAVNQPQLITLLDHDYVIWRDEEGSLNAIDNICPHAGANLAKGGYIVDFQGKDCLACPYHGNKVQFFGDGKVIVDGNVSSQAIQVVLPLQVIDGLVWTYGLSWQEEDGKSVSTPIEPKLPIPDYLHVRGLSNSQSQLELQQLNHVDSQPNSVDCNLAQMIWNIHDGEHFAGAHRDTMLTRNIKIDNLIQDEHKLFWQLTQYKRDDRAAKLDKMSLLVDKVILHSYNAFLPSLVLATVEYQGNIIISVLTMYPESETRVRVCLDTYTDLVFSWWQKLIKLPRIGNIFRDRLITQDIAILENLNPNFEKKIALKNDTPAQLAMDYLQTWHS